MSRAHQDHYEQMGSMDARLAVEGRKECELLNMSAFRDHSFGMFSISPRVRFRIFIARG